MLEGDQFIGQQIGAWFAHDPCLATAYLVTDTGGGLVGGLQRQAYFGALTPTRLYLVTTRVGAFKPLLENHGVRTIERAQISGVYFAGASLVIGLVSGERLELVVPKCDLVSGQATLPTLLAAQHGKTEAASEIGRRWRMRSIVTMVAGLAIAGAYVYYLVYGGRAEVSVDCVPADGDAIECTARHTGGGADAKACWNIVIECANGHKPIGPACVDVPADGQASVTLVESDFRGLDKCDTPTGSRMHGLEIEVD
jgi:hypothetical protein